MSMNDRNVIFLVMGRAKTQGSFPLIRVWLILVLQCLFVYWHAGRDTWHVTPSFVAIHVVTDDICWLWLMWRNNWYTSWQITSPDLSWIGGSLTDLDCVDCNPLDIVNMSCYYVYELNIIMNFWWQCWLFIKSDNLKQLSIYFSIVLTRGCLVTM